MLRPAHERPVFLWGPPGSGKSTAGALAARALGLPFVDTDAVLAERHGAPAGELLRALGEPAFRAHERAVVREQLAGGPAVVALGGGALLDRALRLDALEGAFVLALAAAPSELASRISSQRGGPARPLLEGAASLSHALDALLASRAEAYAEVHATLDALGTPEAVTARVAAAVETLRASPAVVVALGARTYRVVFDALSTLAARLSGLAPSKSLLVLDRGALVAPAVSALASGLVRAATTELPGRGDVDKTLENVSRVWDDALAAGLDRDGLIVAVGGGVTTDLAGFAASTLLRGVRFVSAPTTLLAMVDASVGGKTGVDHARGKNLLGSMHQPSFVLCDPSVLATVTHAERRSGLAEVAKVALACDPALCAYLSPRASALRAQSLDAIGEALPHAVAAKARVVALDEREQGPRASLNFGHTVGHAVEHAARYAVPHGDCVALGMRAALALGERLGVTPSSVRREAESLLDALGLSEGLPEELRGSFDFAAAELALAGDKKRRAGGLRFVLLDALGSSKLVAVGADDARGALRGVR